MIFVNHSKDVQLLFLWTGHHSHTWNIGQMCTLLWFQSWFRRQIAVMTRLNPWVEVMPGAPGRLGIWKMCCKRECLLKWVPNGTWRRQFSAAFVSLTYSASVLVDISRTYGNCDVTILHLCIILPASAFLEVTAQRQDSLACSYIDSSCATYSRTCYTMEGQ